MHHSAIIIALLLAASLANPTQAARFDSTYTDIDFDQCTVLTADDFGADFACPGYKGYPVYIAEGDLRLFVSYGFGAKSELAATQTPPPFNYLGKKIEWRLSNASGNFAPIATIVRYFVDRNASNAQTLAPNQVLVVTQLQPGNTCHIGYIDATANPNANELARQIADKAGQFNCASDTPQRSAPFTAW